MTESAPRLERLTDADLPVTVGVYQLVVALGERGEGRVFRAEDARGQMVELTAIWPELLASPGLRDDVLQELNGLRDFAHPGAVRVLDVGTQRSGVWFASTPVVGVTLGELATGPVRATPRQVLEVAVAALDVLDAAHSRVRDEVAQLHRGLTPDRILVSENGQVMVRGFGLGALPLGTGHSGRTTAGSWASPEQVGRRGLGPSSDLFSLGAIVAFALLGRSPFRARAGAIPSERVGEIVRVLARGEIFSRVEGRAMGLGSAMQGLLAVDPASRFPSAAQAREALRAVVARLPAGEPVGDAVARVLVDHAATVAAPGGVLPTSRDLLPLESLAPVPGEEETADTDADFLLPSQRMEAARLREEARLAPDPVPAPRPAPPPPAPVPGPRRPAPIAAPRRPLPVAAPPPAWAPPMAPADPGLRASGAPPLVRRGPSAPPPPTPAAAQMPAPRKRRPKPTSRPPVEPAQDELDPPSGGRLITVLALVVIVLGILGLIVVTLQDPAPSLESEPLSRPRVAQGVAGAPVAEPPPAAAAVSPEPAPPEPVAPSLRPEAVSAEITPAVAEPSTPKRPPSTAPVEMPDGPVTLTVSHRPLSKGQAGSSGLISARVQGPAGIQVVLHYGPSGGPHSQLSLRAKSGGRFEEWLNFPPSPGASLEYWLVATHPAAPSSAASGSAGNPHRLVLE